MGRLSSASICLVLIILIFGVRLMYNEHSANLAEASSGGFRYSIVPRVFATSEVGTEPEGYDFVSIDSSSSTYRHLQTCLDSVKPQPHRAYL